MFILFFVFFSNIICLTGNNVVILLDVESVEILCRRPLSALT